MERDTSAASSRISSRSQIGLVVDVPEGLIHYTSRRLRQLTYKPEIIFTSNLAGQSVPRPLPRDRVTQTDSGKASRSPIKTIICRASSGCSRAPAELCTELYLSPRQGREG